MTNLPYNFRGKPMAPYDKKKPGRINGGALAVIAFVVLLLALFTSFTVWLVMRKLAQHSAQEQKIADSEENVAKAVVELPPPKSADAPSATKASSVEKQQLPQAAPQQAKPSNPKEAAKHLNAASKLFGEEKYAACREECWAALALVNEDDPQWSMAAELVGKASMAIFATDIRAPEKIFYSVKSGDSLLKIALSNNTTMEAIRKSSRLAPGDSVIRPGQRLSIYKGQWALKVSKSHCRLYLYEGESNGVKRLFKVYAVGIGRQDRTPAGAFELGVKVAKPDWYNSNGKKFEYGSPENILGTRWMALTPTGGTSQDLKGYGIHGTNDAAGVGKPASNGCVRMRNEDVDELFAITPMKTPVEIVE